MDADSFMSLLPRKILMELAAMTLLGLFGISLVMTLVLAMVEAVRLGMDPISVLTVIPYMVPTLLPYTLPVCLLYACVLVYGGMSSANEIVAVKSAGINVMRLIEPAILLGIAGVALGIYITDRVIPKCNLRLHEVLLSDLEGAVLSYLKNNNGRMSGDQSSYEMAVAEVKDNKLIGIIIIKKNAEGQTIANIRAKEAVLKVVRNPVPGEPPQIKATLKEVELRLVKGGEGSGRFGEETVDLPMPNQLWKDAEKKLECLSYLGCWQRSRENLGKAREVETQLAWRGAIALLNGQPVQHFQNVMRTEPNVQRQLPDWHHRKARDAVGEMHMRGSHSFAALPFVLLGCPISILLTRKDPLQTFFLCFAPIIVFYYPSVILTFNIFKEGVDDFTYLWGQALMWAPSAGMLLAAASAMRKLVRS
jgi:lipopolysaccharide export system permease protein